jgi:methyl-accepting chemotaxis protein
MPRLDFSKARVMHRTWKNKLAVFLAGRGTLTKEQVFYHEDCDLGKWLYSEGLLKYEGIPEMHTLERTHEKLHTYVRKLVALKEAGNDAGVEQTWKIIDKLSEEILALLTEIETKEKQ